MGLRYSNRVVERERVQELVDILQAEQHQLDVLHYRLTVLGLVLAHGDLRHVRRATTDTGAARQRLREIDLLRATAALLYAPPGTTADDVPTARELACVASHPWAGILRDQHETLSSLVSEVEVAGFHTAEQARSAIHDLAESEAMKPLDHPLEPGETRSGRQPVGSTTDTAVRRGVHTTWRAVPFDDMGAPDDQDLAPLTAERALQDALLAAGRLRVPSLLAFLR
jgi:hypothetical protein